MSVSGTVFPGCAYKPPASSSPHEPLPPGLYREGDKLLYQFQSTTYQLIPFPLEETRFSEIYELSQQAGFDDTLEDWKQHLRLARYAYAFIETKTNRLITTGLAVVFDHRLVRIIDILTESSHRNRGLARTLFAYLLFVISQDPNLKTLELEASASGSALYEKFSFQIDYEILSYVQHPIPMPVTHLKYDPPDLQIQNDHELETICQLDEKASGFSRAHLIHEVPRDQILVDKEGAQITGFLVYFEDATGIRIGPWIQSDGNKAEVFLNNALQVIHQKYPDKKIYIHVPHLSLRDKPVAIPFLEKIGFARDETIRTYHMSKGVKLQRDQASYYAIWSTNWA